MLSSFLACLKRGLTLPRRQPAIAKKSDVALAVRGQIGAGGTGTPRAPALIAKNPAPQRVICGTFLPSWSTSLAFGLGLFASAAQGQEGCAWDYHANVLAALNALGHEQAFIGHAENTASVQVYTSPESGAWALIISSGTLSCVAAQGTRHTAPKMAGRKG